MVNTSSEHRPGRILKYSAPLLVVVLLAYAAFLVSQSWREAKSEQASQLATIAALSANSIDIYFTQLQIGMRDLGDELPVTHSKADLDRAYTMVSRFQGLHSRAEQCHADPQRWPDIADRDQSGPVGFAHARQ